RRKVRIGERRTAIYASPMPTRITDPGAIDRHLGSPRDFNRRTHHGPLRPVLDLILDTHQVTVETGPEDTWCDREIPLRYVLPLYDDGRRRRGSEITIDLFSRTQLVERRLALHPSA